MTKILFIEDESALQKSFNAVLTREGYNVLSALDGEIGIRLAKSEKPALILLDLILPKINGFEVLLELKKDSETKDIPVIILTNLERMKDIEKALESGASTYLVKADYTLDEVVKKVREALGQEKTE